jgi:hypothetical protein
MGYGYAVSSNRPEATAVLGRLQSSFGERYVSPYDVAIVHLVLDERDEAIGWLRKALEERSPWMGYLGVESQMDALRPDPRFKEMLERVGLPT